MQITILYYKGNTHLGVKCEKKKDDAGSRIFQFQNWLEEKIDFCNEFYLFCFIKGKGKRGGQQENTLNFFSFPKISCANTMNNYNYLRLHSSL